MILQRKLSLRLISTALGFVLLLMNVILMLKPRKICTPVLNQTGWNIEYELEQKNTNESVDCIEENICKVPDSEPTIYVYTRTDFDKRVNESIDYNAFTMHPIPVVPRKVHFVYLSRDKFTFRFHHMIAMIAATRFVKPEAIYFWHDNLPFGELWEETKKRIPNLYLVYREIPRTIRGQKVMVIQHVSDVIRLEVLLEYGGIYLDLDSVVVNPVDPLLVFDVTMGNAIRTTLANGMMFSKPWSDFFKLWHREYAAFDDRKWDVHSTRLPYKLYKKYPGLIHIEPKSLCHPSFQDIQFLYGDKHWDFEHNNYVVHLFARLRTRSRFWKKEFEENAEIIKKLNTTVGRIMRYIYYSNSIANGGMAGG